MTRDSVIVCIISVGFVGGQWIVGIIDEVRKASADESSDILLCEKKEFPTGRFLDYFSLNCHHVLSRAVIDNIADAGIPEQISHDPEWVMSRYKEVIEFGRIEREAEYTPEERWKCRYCQFAKSCCGNPSLESPSPSSPPTWGRQSIVL
ncbi:hypothetical protein ARALYDRAFT_916933 [Arabidopsis lyrata subsp. lyrata]|uniref:Uncharacterized protein n=1 Tax=Arabidopsis lyrata subsp. lyrata TaxID=81972 RepID=D7MU28_ARALL|nr:hypothetical protein ARALYDRAFT_916933 [Arabidopsis lyrata subsp. lyrata]